MNSSGTLTPRGLSPAGTRVSTPRGLSSPTSTPRGLHSPGTSTPRGMRLVVSERSGTGGSTTPRTTGLESRGSTTPRYMSPTLSSSPSAAPLSGRSNRSPSPHSRFEFRSPSPSNSLRSFSTLSGAVGTVAVRSLPVRDSDELIVLKQRLHAIACEILEMESMTNARAVNYQVELSAPAFAYMCTLEHQICDLEKELQVSRNDYAVTATAHRTLEKEVAYYKRELASAVAALEKTSLDLRNEQSTSAMLLRQKNALGKERKDGELKLDKMANKVRELSADENQDVYKRRQVEASLRENRRLTAQLESEMQRWSTQTEHMQTAHATEIDALKGDCQRQIDALKSQLISKESDLNHALSHQWQRAIFCSSIIIVFWLLFSVGARPSA